jgi:hypothetical protein
MVIARIIMASLLLTPVVQHPGVHETDTNRLGYGYKDIELAFPNPLLGEKACQQDSQGESWTNVKPGIQGFNAESRLKSEVQPFKQDNYCISGVKAGAGTGTGITQKLQRIVPKRPPRILLKQGSYFLAGDKHGKVDIFDTAAKKIQSFDGNFTRRDGFAVGDVNGDGLEEIVIAHDGNHMIRVFTQQGAVIYSFNGNFTSGDRLATGDIDGDGKDEIIIAGDKHGVVDIFSQDGSKKGSFQAGFSSNDALTVDDIVSDFRAEVIIHGDKHGAIDIFNGTGEKIGSFKSGIHTQHRRDKMKTALGVGRNKDGMKVIVLAWAHEKYDGTGGFSNFVGYSVLDSTGKNLLYPSYEIYKTLPPIMARCNCCFTFGDRFKVRGSFLFCLGDRFDYLEICDMRFPEANYNFKKIGSFALPLTEGDGFDVSRRHLPYQ